jgi:hypothetical protein
MSSRYVDDNYDYGTTYAAGATTYDTPSTTYDTTGYGLGTTGYGAGYGTTTYNPDTGAYDQHLDYRTDGTRRHHRERLDDSGVYRHRDVDRRDDGTARVHREYDNPNTGTSYHRDYER